jgi:hypothetical protein
MAHMRTCPVVISRGAPSVLLLAALLGCTSGTANPNTTVTPQTLAIALANSFCAAQAACGPTATADGGTVTAVDAAVDGGIADCLDRATLSAEQQLALVSTAFSEGLLTLDPTVTMACANAYQATSCTALAGRDGPDVQAALDDPACTNLFVGYIPIGERCDMTAECVIDGFCLAQATGQHVTSITGNGTLGVCFPYATLGEACNTTGDCLPPLTCNPTSNFCN